MGSKRNKDYWRTLKRNKIRGNPNGGQFENPAGIANMLTQSMRDNAAYLREIDPDAWSRFRMAGGRYVLSLRNYDMFYLAGEDSNGDPWERDCNELQIKHLPVLLKAIDKLIVKAKNGVT